MGILIGADFVPTKSNKEWFEKGQVKELIGADLYQKIIQADYRIFNLEVPLTNFFQPIKKCGPNLIAHTNTINTYKKLGVNLFTLANNHILDQGVDGVISTQNILESVGINYVGLKSEAFLDNSYHIFLYDGKKIGVYACTEHEFSTLNMFDIIANPYDEKKSCEEIKALKEKCDYVIVLYHGGKEYYRYPSPKLQDSCRKMISFGANLVICQHSHCIGCEEKYKSGTIVYGQGNFLFDLANNDYSQTGLLIELDSNFKISYIPLKKRGNSISIATESEAVEIINAFNFRSKEIQQKDFVVNNYNRFTQEMVETYLWTLSGKEGFIFRVLNKLTNGKLRAWNLHKKYNDEAIMKIYNYIICEAHNELLINILERKIYG